MEYEWIQGGKCSECGMSFDGWHLASKTTCSAKCRKQRERRQKERRNAHSLAFRELQKMREGIKQGESLEEYRAQLQHLKAEINDLLLLAKDPDAVARQAMLQERARKQ